jgi:hypothetical protein
VEIALENAREGCVRETWGAVYAVVQSMSARDDQIRCTMLNIATDELHHAALSWDLDGWLSALLGPEQRESVRAERARAISTLELEFEAAAAVRPEWHALPGLPSSAVGRSLLASLRANVWASA